MPVSIPILCNSLFTVVQRYVVRFAYSVAKKAKAFLNIKRPNFVTKVESLMYLKNFSSLIEAKFLFCSQILPLIRILSQSNPVQTLPSFFRKIHFDIILPYA
jgi:hypothetical protein